MNDMNGLNDGLLFTIIGLFLSTNKVNLHIDCFGRSVAASPVRQTFGPARPDPL